MATPYPVLAAALELAKAKRTAALKVKRGLERATLWFEDGQLVAVEAGSIGETLGRVLWMQGVLAPEQYASALDLMTERPGKRLGEVLDAAGIIPNDKVVAGLHLQSSRKAVRCLEWQGASTEVAQADVPPAHRHRTDVSVEALTQEVAARLDDAELEGLLAPARNLYGKLTGGVLETLMAARLPTSLRTLMQRFAAGGDRLGDVAECGNEEHERVVAGLLLSESLSLSETPLGAAWEPSVSLEEGLEEEISGLRSSIPIPPPSSASDLPDSSRPSPDPDGARGNGTLGRLRLNRVTLSLRKIPEREAKDDRDARLLAELHYINAMTLAKIGHWERSLVEGERAVLHYPRGLEYAVVLGRAKWKLSQGSEQKASTQTELEELLVECALSEPTMALAYFVRAELLLETDQDVEAERHLKRALRLNPRFSEAQQRLKLVERRRSSLSPSGSHVPAAAAVATSSAPAPAVGGSDEAAPVSGVHEALSAPVGSADETLVMRAQPATADSGAAPPEEASEETPAPSVPGALAPTTSRGGRKAIVVFLLVVLIAGAVAYWRFRM